MEELKVKVVEVSQEKEQPQGRKLNIFFIFLNIIN